MSGKKNSKNYLDKYAIIAVDTNIFIYYFDRNSQFYTLADSVFTNVLVKKKQVITSILTLTELLSYQTNESLIDKLEEELFLVPNIVMHDVTRTIAVKAAVIRRKYNVRLPDAIQLATALQANADIFITNDKRLKHFKELPVRLLSSF